MRFHKLSSKLLVWFLPVTLLPLFIYSSFGYFYTVKRLKSEAIKRLTEISEHKLEKLENYFKSNEDMLELISYNPILISLMEQYNLDNNENRTELLKRKSLHEELKQYLDYYTYYRNLLYDVFLINRQGNIIFTVLEEDDYGENLFTGTLKDTQLAKTFKNALSLTEVGLSNFEHYAPSGEPAAFMGVPIYNRGNLLGVVCIQLSIHDIFDLARDYTGLGGTGETVLARQEGKQLKIVAPLRHELDAAFEKVINIGDKNAYPIQVVSQAMENIEQSVDYRGEKVFAISRYLFYTGWGIVVKMDSHEIFATAQKYKHWLIILGLITIIAVMLIAAFVSRSIGLPIRTLQEAILRLAKGDLSQKVDIKRRDEIGLLGQSFNSMAHDLERSHNELTKRTRSLENANKEIKTFAYIVSHDLRSPLVNLKGFSGELTLHLDTIRSFMPELLKNSDDALKQKIQISIDDKIPHALHFINTSVDKMDRLVKSILKLSRLGHKKLDLVEIDVNKLVQRIIDSYSFQIEEKKTEVVVNDLPVIEADLVGMEQIFSNIVSNAVNYFEPTRQGKIEISAKDAKNETVFYVKDNGRGIAEDEMHKVFEIFRRAGKQDVKGEGMGLAYVKTLLHLHRGVIRCVSTLGEGTTFIFTIPKNIRDETV